MSLNPDFDSLEARLSSLCCTDAHHCSPKPICLMTCGQCKSITLIVCAMLLQEDEAKIAALNTRLKKEQKGKAAAEVSFSTSCLIACCHAFT